MKQNREGSFPQESRVGSKAMGRGIAIGYAIGMGPGLAIGIALDNIGMGIAIGAGVGVSIGVALGASYKKKEEEKAGILRKQENMPKEVMMPKVIALIIALAGLLVLGWYFFAKMN